MKAIADLSVDHPPVVLLIVSDRAVVGWYCLSSMCLNAGRAIFIHYQYLNRLGI